jgi:nitrile hydratase accessory protein
MIDQAAARRAAKEVSSIPRDADGPVFREPWEAQAFAMTLALHERGVFTWAEWTTALGAEIRRAQGAGDSGTGETYYLHWLAALERLVAEKGVTSGEKLARTKHAWEHACERTPHGKPIELQPSDFR